MMWLKDLQLFRATFDNILREYINSSFNSDMVSRLLAPKGIDKSLTKIQAFIKEEEASIKLKVTPEQEAWDNLTRLKENLKAYERANSILLTIEKYFERSKLLSESFQQAKDNVLNNLYEGIKGHFVELYKKLHGNDENNFTALLASDGAGLNFEVDFYGYGSHPPHALHSEGHQDSMGLCLYLALAEKINEGLINLVILDDVVMSIDTGHRKGVCTILKKNFPDRQFIITTHDKTWTNQLKYNGVVNSKEITEFYNWNINTGPLHFNYQVEIWDPINDALERNDVPEAAFHLRRGLEQFFEMVCNDIQANIKYKSEHKYELGEFFKAAMSQYHDLIKRAKSSAQSWSVTEEFERLIELDSTRSQILRRIQSEQWAINENVHYNNWANFTVNEFRSVVEAFHDLCLLLKCSKCGGILYLTTKNQNLNAVRCNCGKINWNLVRKKN